MEWVSKGGGARARKLVDPHSGPLVIKNDRNFRVGSFWIKKIEIQIAGKTIRRINRGEGKG